MGPKYYFSSEQNQIPIYVSPTYISKNGCLIGTCYIFNQCLTMYVKYVIAILFYFYKVVLMRNEVCRK